MDYHITLEEVYYYLDNSRFVLTTMIKALFMGVLLVYVYQGKTTKFLQMLFCCCSPAQDLEADTLTTYTEYFQRRLVLFSHHRF